MYFYKVCLKELRDGDIWVTTEECFKAISRLEQAQDHKCCFQEIEWQELGLQQFEQ